jgi:ubiquinone/menaquinone biosynthesis C-methylase UbiE
MALARVLEPEEMAGADEAAEYDAMDFSATDDAFARRAAELARLQTRTAEPVMAELGRPVMWIIDIGCGNAKIPLAIASLAPASRVCAVEMSGEMLAVAVRNREKADSAARKTAFVRGDAKNLPFASGSVGLVVSNSLIHHIPDPSRVFTEVARITQNSQSQPRVLIRDLLRPETEARLAEIAAKYSGGWSPLQMRLYKDSLHAALSLEEVRAYASDAGLQGVCVEQITDRHWSLETDA